MAYELNIWDTLAAIDQRKFGYWNSLTEDERKGFAPIVVLRWLSIISQPNEDAELLLFLVNEIANVNFFDLYEHPELQMLLMTSCGLGRKLNHKWLGMVKQPPKRSPVLDFLSTIYVQANDLELGIVLSKLGREGFVELLADCALPPNECEELTNAHDRLNGIKVKTSKSKSKKGS